MSITYLNDILFLKGVFMSEFEQSSEKTEELHRSDFIKKYPYLKKLANNANFIGPNYLELNNLDTIERDTEKEYKTGTRREVIFYHDFVLKTPENIDAKSAIEIQENMPEDLPIVRYSGIIKNIGDNKEYLIEPKGTQFDKFYLASKNKINDEKFEEMLKKFISGFEKEGKIPFEFSSDDLDNHLLVFWQYDKLTLKMTDVNALRDIKDEDKTKDMPQNYLNHLKVLAKSKTLEKTDLSSEELHNKLYTHNVRVSIHHIKNELVVIYSFMDLLEHSNLTKKDESVNALNLLLLKQEKIKITYSIFSIQIFNQYLKITQKNLENI